MLTVKVFDFDDPESWKKVQAVVNDPLAVRALSAGMRARCKDLEEEEWTPELGPWQLSDRKNANWPALEALSPKPDDPNWYRIYGHAEAIAPWCAAIGHLLYPDHQWLVWYNRHRRKYMTHAAGMGFQDDQSRSIVIMDILLGREALLERREWELMKLLTAEQAFSRSIEDVIERLETGRRVKAG